MNVASSLFSKGYFPACYVREEQVQSSRKAPSAGRPEELQCNIPQIPVEYAPRAVFAITQPKLSRDSLDAQGVPLQIRWSSVTWPRSIRSILPCKRWNRMRRVLKRRQRNSSLNELRDLRAFRQLFIAISCLFTCLLPFMDRKCSQGDGAPLLNLYGIGLLVLKGRNSRYAFP